jgi:limonene-1,2-epoxide hydrolase
LSFDDDGKITTWRDYFDSAELTAKIGRFKPATTVERR